MEKTATEIGYSFDGVNIPTNNTGNYSLAYSQFVVPLVKAVQELSKQNEEMKREMEELKTLIKGKTEGSIKISESNDVLLFQNTPNPFTQTTIIRYSLPVTAKKDLMKIISSGGVKMKEFDLKNNSGQTVEITGGQLSAGTYIYSLFVDDILIDSKQMILTH